MKYALSPALDRSAGGIDVAPTAATPGSAPIRDMISLKFRPMASRSRQPRGRALDGPAELAHSAGALPSAGC
jgi:hypothetical protein